VAQIGLARIRFASRWMYRDSERLSESHRAKVREALAHSQRLAKLHEMGVELAALWERSSASREQLLSHLQDWCRRAEASGIRALEDFSLRLRSYA